ncbi:MAG: single-stranded DNA-binding protein [Erysipelotrichaceae bacterium]|nr:single-stranded DNA-binding protein [Erysipelotrichaceae bacterium]
MINRVVLVGRLTKDVEVRKTQTGLSVASFTVAINRRASKDSQDRQADFINCVAWRNTADFMGAYCKKGALIGVEGRIQTRNYEGNDGKRVYVTEVVSDSVQLLESRSVSAGRMNEDTMQFTSNDNSGYEADSSFEDFNSGLSLDISSDDLPF